MRTLDQMVQEYGAGIAPRILAISRLIVGAEKAMRQPESPLMAKVWQGRRNGMAQTLWLLCAPNDQLLDGAYAPGDVALNAALNYARSIVANSATIDRTANSSSGF